VRNPRRDSLVLEPARAVVMGLTRSHPISEEADST